MKHKYTDNQCRQTDRKLVANRLILLPITLRDSDSPIIVIMVKRIIRYIPHTTQPTTAIQEVLERRLDAGPDLDAGSITSVGHGDVVDVQVLDNVRLALVLAEGADADAVRAGAVEVLHDDVGAVGLEGDAVVRVDDDRVLDDDAVGAVRVPAVRVGDLDAARARGHEVHVADDDVCCVGDHVEPLLVANCLVACVRVHGGWSCHCSCLGAYIG